VQKFAPEVSNAAGDVNVLTALGGNAAEAVASATEYMSASRLHSLRKDGPFLTPILLF
jgi:hypothetical protein